MFDPAQVQIQTEQLIALALGAGVTSIGYFLKAALSKNESNRDDIAKINKDLGLLEAAKDRAREADDKHHKEISDLHRSILELRERVLIIETERDSED